MDEFAWTYEGGLSILPGNGLKFSKLERLARGQIVGRIEAEGVIRRIRDDRLASVGRIATGDVYIEAADYAFGSIRPTNCALGKNCPGAIEPDFASCVGSRHEMRKCKGKCSQGMLLHENLGSNRRIKSGPRQHGIDKNLRTARKPSERTSNGQEHDLPVVRQGCRGCCPLLRRN